MLLIRDEVANMVWASSVACRLPSGETKRDSEAGYETRHFFERPAEPAAAPGAGRIRREGPIPGDGRGGRKPDSVRPRARAQDS